VFGVFVQNVLSSNFLLVFGSGAVVNLNTENFEDNPIGLNLLEFSIITGLEY
jgi:hypothetical protein